MSKLKHYIYRFETVMLTILSVLFSIPVGAQLPQDLPHQIDPVDFDRWQNILIYVGLPVLMVVTYIFLRRRARRKREGR